MIISTWNIGSYFEKANPNLEVISDAMKTVRPDVFCVQEFPNDEAFVSRMIEWSGLSSHLYRPFCMSHINQGFEMGTAVFSNFEMRILDEWEIARPHICVYFNGKKEELHMKKALAVELRNDTDKYLMIAIHGHSFHRYGLDDRDDLLIETFCETDKRIKMLELEFPDQKIIVLGDFNCGTPRKFLPYLDSKYIDLFDGSGTRPSGRKTDAIFLKKGEPCKDFGIYKGTLDHFMLWAEI